MNALNINTKTEVITEVKVGNVPIYDVLSEAKTLAHNVCLKCLSLNKNIISKIVILSLKQNVVNF